MTLQEEIQGLKKRELRLRILAMDAIIRVKDQEHKEDLRVLANALGDIQEIASEYVSVTEVVDCPNGCDGIITECSDCPSNEFQIQCKNCCR